MVATELEGLATDVLAGMTASVETIDIASTAGGPMNQQQRMLVAGHRQHHSSSAMMLSACFDRWPSNWRSVRCPQRMRVVDFRHIRGLDLAFMPFSDGYETVILVRRGPARAAVQPGTVYLLDTRHERACRGRLALSR